MNPQNNPIEPTNKGHRILVLSLTVLLTAGVIGGSTWYVADKNLRVQKAASEKEIAASKAEADKANQDLANKVKEVALLNGEVTKTKEEQTKYTEVEKVLKAFIEAKKDKNYKLSRSYMAATVQDGAAGNWTEDGLKTELEFGLESYAIKEAGTFPTATTYKVTIREQHISQPLDPNEGPPSSYDLDIPITLTNASGSWLIDSYVVPMGLGKPVIYLYPETKTQISVKVKPDGGITFSEPSYDSGWEVFADPSGLLSWNGQSFPYLYWEGNTFKLQKPSEGFVINREQVSGFLDDKLSILGLNEIEKVDFKEYWVPRMARNPYYFINFIPQKEIDRIAPLDISPKPDTVIRVLMNYKGLNSPVSVTEQNLQKVERHGYAAVEWGGVFE